MRVANTVRQQHLDFVADQLFTVVAEHLLCLAVDDRNLTVVVHDNHSVGGRFDQDAKIRLRFLGLQLVCAHEASHVSTGYREYTVVRYAH